MKPALTQMHSDESVKPVSAVLAPAAPAEPTEPDACSRKGEALDAALEDDRAWREQRSRKMQLRLERVGRLCRLGWRLREWSWRCLWGGGFLLVLTALAFYFTRNLGVPGWLLLLVSGSLILITLFGLVLLPVSKLLRESGSFWQEQLLQEADRDHLEV